MKKIFLVLILFFGSINILNAEVNRIISGNKEAKITIIAYESLTCGHCADFHKDIYPQLKKDYIDTGLVKIEFRHFPLDVAAFNASKISQCKIGKGLEILNSLYSNQQEWVRGNTAEEINDNLKIFISAMIYIFQNSIFKNIFSVHVMDGYYHHRMIKILRIDK